MLGWWVSHRGPHGYGRVGSARHWGLPSSHGRGGMASVAAFTRRTWPGSPRRSTGQGARLRWGGRRCRKRQARPPCREAHQPADPLWVWLQARHARIPGAQPSEGHVVVELRAVFPGLGSGPGDPVRAHRCSGCRPRGRAVYGLRGGLRIGVLKALPRLHRTRERPGHGGAIRRQWRSRTRSPTFSRTTYRGRTWRTTAAISGHIHRSSPVPCCLPERENGWQGKPPATTSTAGRGVESHHSLAVRTSSCRGTSGQWWASTRWQNLLISTWPTVRMPARSRPSSIPPMPEKRDITVRRSSGTSTASCPGTVAGGGVSRWRRARSRRAAAVIRTRPRGRRRRARARRGPARYGGDPLRPAPARTARRTWGSRRRRRRGGPGSRGWW